MDPLGEAGAAFGFGLSRLLAVSLYLGKPLLPSAHLEPVVRKTDLAARVALTFLRIGFDRLQQVLGLHPGLHGRCDLAQDWLRRVSDPVLGIGCQDLLRFRSSTSSAASRLRVGGLWMVLGWFGGHRDPVPRPPWTPYRVQAGRGSQWPPSQFRVQAWVPAPPRVQIDPVNDGEAVLAGAAALSRSRMPSFRNSLTVRLTVALAKLGMPLDRPFEHQMPEPSSLALSAREHDDLLACRAAKAALGAFICDTPTHDRTANWLEVSPKFA